MNKEILRKVGLSSGEITVYDALLQLGPATTNKIHEKVGIERRNIYDILNKLIERGLVTYIDENKHRTFQLANPNKILSYLDEKKSTIEDLKADVQKELPAMTAMFESSKPELNAEVYRGSEGIKTIWQDMLNHKEIKEIRWIGSGNYMPNKYPAFWKHWNDRRLERKIQSFHLFRDEIRGSMIPNVGNARFLPKEFSGNPTVTAMYGNKVVNFLFGAELFAFVIESKELADNYKAYHTYLWNNVARK